MRFAKLDITVPRAKADIISFSGHERLTTHITDKGTALDTLQRSSSADKHLLAAKAFLEKSTIGEMGLREKQGMFVPKLPVVPRVARLTHGNQIFKRIGIYVRAKQAEWNFMMCGQFAWLMARFTLTFGSKNNLLLLFVPIRPTIIGMATSPCRIVTACESSFRDTHALMLAQSGGYVNGSFTRFR